MKPNIVYFVADQLRSDALHHLGNDSAVTPNLDHLATQGVSFQNCYCQNPVCVPSRCSFLTGLYPHTSGHRTMHYLQKPEEPNILKTMKNNGYQVIWIGRNDVVPATHDKLAYCDEYYDGIHPENRVDYVETKPPVHHSYPTTHLKPDELYSFYIGEQKDSQGFGAMDWGCVHQAIDFLKRKKESQDDRPFFLYVTISFPHPPYGCEKPFYGITDRDHLPPRRPNIDTLKNRPSMLQEIFTKQQLGNWPETRWNELRATYLDMVNRFDYHYGMVESALKENGFYDNSGIFVFSDHGDYTGDYGIAEKVQNCFEDPISNVPLLIKPPIGVDYQAGVHEGLVELLDLSATVAQLTDTKLDYTQFGTSLLPALNDKQLGKDAVFCEGGRIHGEEQAMEKGHGPESPYWPRLSAQGSEGPEHTKAVMIRQANFKFTKRLYESDELYDLNNDPQELHNLIFIESYQDVILRMQQRLLQFYMETGDFVPFQRDRR